MARRLNRGDSVEATRPRRLNRGDSIETTRTQSSQFRSIQSDDSLVGTPTRSKSSSSPKNNNVGKTQTFREHCDQDLRGERIDKLQSILDKHHVTIVSKDSLAVLEDYNFIAICDDSESMMMSAKPREERRLGEKPVTRWHELQEGVTLLVDIVTCFRPEGLDVYFLNSGTVRSVKSSGNQKLQNIFQAGPTGKTPLTKRLKEAAADYSARSELPTIMFIFTDGEPDGGPKKFTRTLSDLVSNSGSFKKTAQFRVQIMACSNNDDEIEWLNEVDHESELIDVTDDYYNEKRRIMAIKGENFTFTRSDWLVKAILGPVDKSVDGVNEGVLASLAAGMMGMGKKSKMQRQTSKDESDEEVEEVVAGSAGIAGCRACGMQ